VQVHHTAGRVQQLAHKDYGFAYSVHPVAWQLEAMKIASRNRPTTTIEI
jgi:hypothetical protein